MKNIYPSLILLFLTLNIYAQSPEKMSYQAIVRDTKNTLVSNKTIGMQISILQSNITGKVVYSETHSVDTNLNGLVSLEIGRGSTSDNFSTIDWSAGPYFIKTETDPTGGTNYTITGTSQLMSVPFALYANTSGSSQTNATNIAKNKTAIELNTAKTSMVLGTTASTALAGNTTTITSDQASAIKENTVKNTFPGFGTTAGKALEGNTPLFSGSYSDLTNKPITITTEQANAITTNTAKISNATHTGDVTGDKALTIANDAVTSAMIKDANITDAKIVTVSASKLTGAVGVANGGTNMSSYRPGDFLYSNSDGELTTLSAGRAGQVLVMDADGTAPEWAAAAGVAKDGYTAGDFLYAGGRGELTTLSAGRAGQVLVMDADGTAPEWGSAIKAYSIGDYAHGGIVFWVDETGQHGLVCAKEDQNASVRWFGGTNGNTQAKGDGVYAGKANTTIIIAGTVSIGDDNATYAARICNELKVTEGSTTYGDWYLPSNDELILMYQSKREINTTAGNNRGSDLSNAYWSSTEIDNDEAFKIDFTDGSRDNTSKATTSSVRAVRAF